MIVDGVEDLTVKTYKPTLIDKSEESQSAYWATHGEPSSKKVRSIDCSHTNNIPH